ncbi:glycosyltransferase family 4 protein [Methylocaldum szegediense]|uniref:UDP-GlcNAc:undecaprenyl-phosphate/decaprenyl-phosphate GlcNAc-1-phosphate transferase n=1 Tax=Methylocaldum szegediense TaxID=73780 RepID=A0ABM9HZL0_9GAMM|nr:MraY family glycosyltransferase [Methylocaldum szegediense]CAI8789725.1 UDP-GlcNAc:undecaprenyl-phosphate/decaprenyl-phosphate GlcNAc-1-phosphate transferase [Methylocaldum szegediense]
MVHFVVFLTALFVTMVLVAMFMRLAPRLGFVDLPDGRKIHRAAIPRIGGIGMVIGAVVSVLVWLDLSRSCEMFLYGVGVIAAFGLWDDRVDLDYRIKFAGQLLAIAVVVGLGGLAVERLPGFENSEIPWLVSYPLTVFFLLGATNATNLADGLDGLAAGLSLLSLACIAFLADLAEGDELVFISLAIIGATLGFLRYNTHPAMVFMGDTGSQFLGFSLGVLALMLTEHVNTAVTPGLALPILGLPIIDTLMVMGQRIAEGRSPFKPDKNHFHHKLLALGFDQYEAVLAIYAIQSLFVISAYLLRYESLWLIAALYLGLSAAIVLFYPLARITGWRLRRGVSPLTGFLKRLRDRVRLDEIPGRILSLLITGFLITGSVTAKELAPDIRYFVAVSLSTWLAARLLRLSIARWIERFVIYACVILVIYSIELSAIMERHAWHQGLKYFFLVLAGVTAVGVRFARPDYFSVTPSDFLVLAILLAAANLPVFDEVNFAKLAIQSAVVLYGAEFVLRKRSAAALAISVGAMAAFVIVGIKTF